jgi:anthranilate phosphoribosyltransferase
LMVGDRATDLRGGAALAADAIDSGRARDVLAHAASFSKMVP